MENGILVELKFVDLMEDSIESIGSRRKHHQHKWVPNNVAEYFFFDEFGFLSISEKRIKDCYQEFTQSMTLIHNNLRTIYNRYAAVALSMDDLNRGADCPIDIHSDIETKGLEYFIVQEKLASTKHLNKEVQQSASATKKQQTTRQLQSDMMAIKMAQPIVAGRDNDEAVEQSQSIEYESGDAGIKFLTSAADEE